MILNKVIVWMLAASICSVSLAMFMVSRQWEEPMPAEVCAELAETAGYESAYTSDGTCWLKLDYGVTLPFPQAMDALGFVFRAAETDKLARLHEVRTSHIVGAK